MTTEDSFIYMQKSWPIWLKTEDGIIDIRHVTRFFLSSIKAYSSADPDYIIYAQHNSDSLVVKSGFKSKHEAIKYLHIIIGDKLGAI